MAISTDERNQTHCPNCLALKSPWQGLAFTCSACGQSFATTQPEHPPESETPETDELEHSFDEAAAVEPSEARAAYDLARSLERRLSLAHTEIKGHMRVEDDLEGRIAELEKALRMIIDAPGGGPAKRIAAMALDRA